MVDSRDDSIENFVTAIVDKVAHRAMDIVEATIEDSESSSRRFSPNCTNSGCRKCNEPKNRNRSLRSTRQSNERMTKNCSCDDDEEKMSRNLEANITDDVNQRASEEIRKIVEGLQGVQIGDSTSIKPLRRVSSLERQVKRTVAEMSGACDILDINLPIAEGQGDVEPRIFHENIVTSMAEVEYDLEELPPAKIAKIDTSIEKQIADNQNHSSHQVLAQRIQPEVSKLRSTCFLHRMIKELEDAEAKQENVLCKSASISAMSQDRIAAWEESEEKFIRTIEETRNEVRAEMNGAGIEPSLMIDESFAIYSLNDAEVEGIVDAKIEELDSRPDSPPLTPLPLPPSPPPPPPLPPAVQEICQNLETEKTSTDLVEDDGSLQKSKRRKKKSVGEKLRTFFRSAFKRGKD